MQSAVLHQIVIMGEATKRLSGDFRANHPTIPWKDIAGMRDVLIHSYDSVDLGAVWRVTQKDLPVVLAQIESLLSDEFP